MGGRTILKRTGSYSEYVDNTSYFEALASYLAHHLSQREPKGRLVFLTGGLNASASGDTLPLVHQGLCLESSVGDDISEVYKEDKEDYNTDNLKE